MRGLVGKGVLVTGGSSGIGYATVRRFVDEGSRVLFCGHDRTQVDQTLTDIGRSDVVAGLCCDVSREADVADLVARASEWLGGIDVLANNAGISRRDPFLQITPEVFDRIVAVNLRGAFLVAQAVAQHMVQRGRGGAIINMSSTNGIGGEEDYAHYNATKAGALLLTKTMAVELGTHNIRVNALCPGYIQTPLNSAIAAEFDHDFVNDYIRTRIPIGRTGTPRTSPAPTPSSPPTTPPSSTVPHSSSTAANAPSCRGQATGNDGDTTNHERTAMARATLSGGDLNRLRQLNALSALRVLRGSPPLTLTQIASRTGLSRPSTEDVVQDLITQG